MREILLYHPGYDTLMVCYPIYPKSRWYKFENDPYGYEGTTAHKMDLMINELDWVLIDSWYVE